MKNEKGEISILGWLILIIIGVGILWYFTGGPERAAQNPEPFIKDPIEGAQGF